VFLLNFFDELRRRVGRQMNLTPDTESASTTSSRCSAPVAWGEVYLDPDEICGHGMRASRSRAAGGAVITPALSLALSEVSRCHEGLTYPPEDGRGFVTGSKD
jgi:hypothetical protein